RAEAARWIAAYIETSQIVQLGDLYRLRSAQAHAFSAVQFMSKDRSEGVLFAFRTHMPPQEALPPLCLRGLDPAALRGRRDRRRALRAGMDAGRSADPHYPFNQ